ncbi:MAG TPA: CusA/CzcA family heavy metal efflux RND transporter [Thermoanaerobaculia bacterium]|jgi:Cu(I)/Ag(I) efflux system membrane protein CusA/SilA|nr:CusA/CzcA family heavy metal efflux RND transporter [Thermoanaerobaculia bacterium]
MIARIIGASARHPLFVLLAVGALILLSVAVLGRIPLDALPDLSDPQVIVFSRWDRSPDRIEAQVTYPLATALLGTSGVKAVRGFSDFGFSYVYAIFEEGTDTGEARSRVLEQLAKVDLPEGVRTQLGPDASGVGWVYQYALVDRSGKLSSTDLRQLQDWTLRFAVQAVPGVAEVASVGGLPSEMQVTADPARLQAYGLSLGDLVGAVRSANVETGGRLIEAGGAEIMVRGRGLAKSEADLMSAVVRAEPGRAPVLLGDVANVALGPALRRGATDLDGEGDAVGAIVVIRQDENALAAIDRVKAKLEELKASLPAGVEIVPTYDRSTLIRATISTLSHELVIEMIVVALVILFFLWHFPSAIVPIVTLPIAVLLAFLPFSALGLEINLMSIAGIAISIGVLVDGAIVEVENAYQRIHLWQEGGKKEPFAEVRLRALQEVGPSVFFSLLVIAVAFLPVFALSGQEGRLFRPLAASKNLTMAVAALLAITLDPALRMLFARAEPFAFRPRWLARIATTFGVGTYRAESHHPVQRGVAKIYEPACRFVLRHPWATIGAAVLIVAASVPAYLSLGTEFMPPLDEGTLLYMPLTLPGLSIGEAQRLLTAEDRILKSFPEVERVFGKAGRAESATDPAPLSMVETTVVLKPRDAWREKPRWWSGHVPQWARVPFAALWPDRISREELIAEMDEAIRAPGVTNSWLQPIQTRILMLSTGLRTPVGVKIYGADLGQIERVGAQVEAILSRVPGAARVFAERTAGGLFLDILPRRTDLARYGLTIADLNQLIATAAGGEPVSTLLDGRARIPVTVRLPRELRDTPEALARLPIDTPVGARVLLGQVADLGLVSGPSMIRDENGFLTGYVYIDVRGRDLGGFVEAARAAVARDLRLPPGVSLGWSGQYEHLLAARERLRLLVPITLGLIFLLLLANTGAAWKATLVMLAVPFSCVGAIWLFWLLDYQVSVAAWVGMIALLGLDAETGVFMLLFLDLSWNEARAAGRLTTEAEIDEAIVHGAVKRARPKLMTVAAAFCGLLPILWTRSAGADVLQRIAAPMIGGLASSFVLELLVYPAVYKLKRRRKVDDRTPKSHLAAPS